jgi:DNA/RNA-binding domain of Phe-tRNA-synthetase-like protein
MMNAPAIRELFKVTSGWKALYPDAHAGILVMGDVGNRATCLELERQKQDLEERLSTRFTGQDRKALEAIPAISAYNAYYKQFKKTYHVQAQLESIAFKGRTIPSAGALVMAMFMAELKNLLLTAGHDLDTLQLPVMLAAASGEESYTLLRGQEQVLKPGDMMMADQKGVISSIVYGPDQRTQIREQTGNVLFAVYAPAGISIEAVQSHLQDIRDYVRLVSPAAGVKALQIYGAQGEMNL